MSLALLKSAVVGVFALLLITVIGVWKVQDWRYYKQLADQAGLHQGDLAAISNGRGLGQPQTNPSPLFL
jgi:hypothetical protein